MNATQGQEGTPYQDTSKEEKTWQANELSGTGTPAKEPPSSAKPPTSATRQYGQEAYVKPYDAELSGQHGRLSVL